MQIFQIESKYLMKTRILQNQFKQNTKRQDFYIRFQSNPLQMINFNQILNSSSQIKEYFSKNTHSSSDYIKLASQLLIQSIKRRQQLKKPEQITHANNKQSKEQQNTLKNHYNIAYIKHNRFLSPSQKKEVTPKVTEVIPISPQKIFIYGKPKVKLDNGYGCPLHQQNCEDAQSEQNQSMVKSYNHNKYPNPAQMLESDNYQYPMQIPRQYQEYLSPKNKQNKKKNKSTKFSDQNQTVGTIRSPKNKRPDEPFNRMTSPKSHLYPNSPTCAQNYTNVESKIKELIQRDKKNREMAKQVEKQKQQISQIEDKQNRLLMMQKYQQDLLKRQKNPQRNQERELWNLKYSHSPVEDNLANFELEQSFQSSSEESIVNLHGHKQEQSRIECYECEIERLRLRKHKAKRAIKVIEKEEAKRSQLLVSIAQNSQMFRDMSMNRLSELSDHSMTIY